MAHDFADRLLRYPLPGNVRELENIISSAVLLEEGRVLTLASAPDLLTFSRPLERRDGKLPTLAELDKQHIQQLMEITGGNRTRAAKILGIGLRTLQRKLKACGELSTLPK